MDETVVFPANWSAPLELTRERPRSVRLTATGIFLTILSGVMAVAALPSALAMRASDARTDARVESLRRDGQDVVATVTGLRRVGKDKQPRVAYVFAEGEGRYQADVKAPLAVWSDLQIGSQLPVRFLPGDPSVNYPTGWEASRVGLVPTIMISCLLLALGGLLWFVLRRDRRLLEDGVPAPAVVTRSRRVKGGYSARYQYRTGDGEVRSSRGAVSRRYDAGEALCLVVDPDNPRRNAPYPMKLYRVREDGAEHG